MFKRKYERANIHTKLQKKKQQLIITISFSLRSIPIVGTNFSVKVPSTNCTTNEVFPRNKNITFTDAFIFMFKTMHKV